MLEIYLFGGVRVHRGNPPVEIRLTKGDKRLLAYLLLNRYRNLSRVKVYGILWGDQREKSARSCLKTALWRLRRQLENRRDGKHYILTTWPGEVGFNLKSDHWLDVAAFEDRVSRATAKEARDMATDDEMQLEDGLKLYNGDLLEEFYEDWMLPDRERLNALYFRGLEHMMRYKRHAKAFDEAATWGRLALSHDPLREDIHRELMRLYTESGRRGMAIRQYRTCCEIMEEQMSISPSQDTRTLYSEILSSDKS